MIDNVQTGRRIAELRLSRGLTQQQLAAIMGVSHQAVSKWESGQALPDIQILLSLTQFFGITVEQLISGEDACGNDAEEPADEAKDEAKPEAKQERIAAEVKEMNASQLVQMAPFMSKEAIEEIAHGICGRMSAGELARIAPFVSPDCIEELIAKHEPELQWDSLRRLAPFMSREAVDALARKIASGETLVQAEEDPFSRTMSDIGKAFDGIGKGLEKGFDKFGRELEKGFDDFGKGVDKAVRKVVRFGENVVSEVNKALNAEEERRKAEQAREERTQALRRRAFERAVSDGRWDWLALHITEVRDDAELTASIAEAARTLGMHDWICENMSDYADMETIEKAIAAGNWDWLGDNIWQFDGDVHEKVALAAVEAENWDWLLRYSDPLELVNCIEDIARAAMHAGQNELLAQLADGHMIEEQIQLLAQEAYATENYDALGRLLRGCGDGPRSSLLLELAGKGDWEHVLAYTGCANADQLEMLMEAAVDQGNFDAIDHLSALL